ncbi:MAG: prepilin peptidase [Planctomycetota bacterium]
MSYRTIAIGILVAAIVGWLIVFPMVESYFKQFEERPTTFKVEELTAFEILRIRSAKLAVFAIVAYLGACLGSFINVVARSAPRRESVILRNSSCPTCMTPIRRIDNFPIISFLVLKGRCRDCSQPIGIRYLTVELVAMAIISILFLFELVTGAANVPGSRHYHYVGIVWILLYTKWPVVGLFLFHTMVYTFLLLLALVELDRQRLPKHVSALMLLVAACLVIAIPTLRPITFDDQLPIFVSKSLPVWAEKIITCLVGGLFGWLAGFLLGKVRSEAPSVLALVLLGISLGWQATITIAVLWLATSLGADLLKRRVNLDWLGPTSLLLGVALLHHPLWNRLAVLW